MRPGLPEMPVRIAALPVDARGYPVPFFAAVVDGQADFRISDPQKWEAAVRGELCWLCGQKLGRFRSFVIGPMCAITRTTPEPATHLDCAEWSVKACPFLSRPNMERRKDDGTEALKENVPGIMIERNPGVGCIWTTRGFNVFDDGHGRPLIRVGKPETVSWWREGRSALLAEVLQSLDAGMPILIELCRTKSEVLFVRQEFQRLVPYLPKEAKEA